MMLLRVILHILQLPLQEEINENEHLAIARHEILCTLEDAVQASSQLVRQGGKVAFVHRSGRLMDIIILNEKLST